MRRKLSTNPLLQKNLNFLHSYNNILRKPFYQQVGDADTYFKQTLRNEPINIVKELKLQSILQETKSTESLNKVSFALSLLLFGL